MSAEDTIVDDDEIVEEIQDWKSLGLGNGQDVVPKRGEKDFAPDGTEVQSQLLEDSRNAMYSALSVRRGHNLKQELVAVWYPEQGEALVPHLKGPYFKDIGRPFTVGGGSRAGPSGTKRAAKELQGAWLSPLETVYLCERGTLRVFLYSNAYEEYLEQFRAGGDGDGDGDAAAPTETEEVPFDYDERLLSLSLSHLYSLAFSKDHTLAEKYQVYSYLKRLGYLIRPYRDSTEEQRQQYRELEEKRRRSSAAGVFSSVWTLLGNVVAAWPLRNSFFAAAYAAVLPRRHYFSYHSILGALRLIPAYSTYDTLKESKASAPSPPLSPAFDVWKPTPQFSKRSPPAPDYQIILSNTNEGPFPSLADIQRLFDSTSHSVGGNGRGTAATAKPVKTSSAGPSKRELRSQRAKERQSRLDPAVQRRIEYTKLRDSKFKYGASGRSFIVALVDNGVVNFVTFGEGDFSLRGYGTDDLAELAPDGASADHGTVW